MLLSIASAVVLPGCSDGRARAAGSVSLDGQPVTKAGPTRAYVTFQPVGGGPKATGSIDESGRFTLSVGSKNSLPPGEYRASVRVCEVTPGQGGYSNTKTVSPESYASTKTSGLVFQLEPGSNDIAIELTTPNR
ncbi:MAG: hypothetical protein AAFV43_16040 [Planctomycetota bacterium]